MSMAMDRFRTLQKKFRNQVRSRKLSAVQKHHVITAAALWQVSEITTAELVMGIRHDRGVVDHLQAEAKMHLKLAGARPHEEKRAWMSAIS
jgi:hypothetical protein